MTSMVRSQDVPILRVITVYSKFIASMVRNSDFYIKAYVVGTQLGTSIEYQNTGYHGEIRKISVLFC